MVDVIKNNADLKQRWAEENPNLSGILHIRQDGLQGTLEKIESQNGFRVFWPDYTPLFVYIQEIEGLENAKRYDFTYHIQDDTFNSLGLVVIAERNSIRESPSRPKEEIVDRFKNEINNDPEKARLAKVAIDFYVQNEAQPSKTTFPKPIIKSNPIDRPNSNPDLNKTYNHSIPSKGPQVLAEEVNDEVLQEIGRRGEVYLYPILCSLFAKVKWLNQEVESLAPYDFEVYNENDNVIYIDCKATDFESPTFFLSSTEWEFVLENSKQYAIYRVSNLKTDSPNINVIQDPLLRLIEGVIYPCSYEKRMLNALIIPLCLAEYI